MKKRHGGMGLGPSEKKICVVDPNDTWLSGWSENFKRLGIQFLRSPAMAHPDHFDMNALLAYAVANDRENELIESGCAEIRKLHGLGQTQVGLWKLPSTSLFEDFCGNLARQLRHDYVKGYVVDLTRCDDDETGDIEYTITLADGGEITSSSVVLALGPTGEAIVPRKIRDVPEEQLVSWTRMREKMRSHHKNVLVVGGGLTAVQVAQHCLRQGRRVRLYSRRSLVERHFDIDTCWFDKRSANRHISEFYHQPEAERLAALREVRGGMSVPPMYMEDVRAWQARGKLTLVHGNDNEPEFLRSTEDGGVWISMGRERLAFDCVVLACGIEPNCAANPLVENIREKYPAEQIGGFPDVSVDLEWSKNLFVVGALASLNVGPDGGNITGARRAASIVADALECKSWLRDERGRGALANPFTELFWDEDDSGSDGDGD